MNTVIVRCPAMACPLYTGPQDGGLPIVRTTTELPCEVEAETPDGEDWLNGTLIFDPTFIRRDGLGRMLVDQTTAHGTMEDGSLIAVTLLPERVIGPVAQKVDVTDPSWIFLDGEQKQLKGHFPAVAADLQGTVGPVIAYLRYQP